MAPELLPSAPSGERPGSVRRAFRWMFVNRRNGRVTIAQWPNIALSVFLAVSVVARLAHPAGEAGRLTRVLAVGALLVWALDEVLRGVNPFRRVLGVAVVVVTVVGLIR
jgi:hypothetical protein